jgi:hypothetical protein
VVTISIIAAALDAIEATLPKGREADCRPDGKGGYLITLPHGGDRPADARAKSYRALAAAKRLDAAVAEIVAAVGRTARQPIRPAARPILTTMKGWWARQSRSSMPECS